MIIPTPLTPPDRRHTPTERPSMPARRLNAPPIIAFAASSYAVAMREAQQDELDAQRRARLEPETEPEPRRWELVLPYKTPPLTLNSRPGNRHAHARIVARLRYDAHMMAVACRMPKGLEHVRITLTYVPADVRTRDRSNLQPTLKALIDGLALGKGKVKGYGLVVDDDDAHVTEVIEIADKGPALNGLGNRLKLTIEEIL